MTDWCLKEYPGMFLCKFCDFLILNLTHNRCQKTHAGEREERAPVRQVFPVSLLVFRIMFPLFLCVSALLHSSSILLFFLFLYFLVFDIFLPPLYSLFVLSLSAFGEHRSSIGVFVPAGLACAQMASEKPRHCAAACYGPGTSQTAPVSCV